MAQLYENNSSTVLIEDLLPADTIINLGPGEGDQFPLPDAGDPDSFFMLTLEDVNANYEICECTGRSGDILTVVRGQESTSPAGFAIGSRCESRLTAGSLDNFKQVVDQFKLRGGIIDSDGIRYWHQQDPSTYQFFQIRYYTADVFGIPVMHIEPPPSLPGVHWMAGSIGSDGTQRVIRLGPDSNGDAPFPATGEIHVEVPGVMRWSHIATPLNGNLQYATYTTAQEGGGNELMFLPAGPAMHKYRYICQDGAGVERSIEMTNGGGLHVFSSLRLKNAALTTYSTALAGDIGLTVDPSNPGGADWMFFSFTAPTGAAEREFSYTFFTSTRDETPDPDEFIKKPITLIDGGIRVSEDPQGGNFLTRRSWVEQLLTGPNLDSIQAALYGRTVMWTNDAGVSDGSSQTYLNSLRLADFYTIEITAKFDNDQGDTQFYTQRVDSQTMIDKGFTNSKWAIMQDGGASSQSRETFFNPTSQTTFNGSVSNNPNSGIVRVLGLHPKAQPVA